MYFSSIFNGELNGRFDDLRSYQTQYHKKMAIINHLILYTMQLRQASAITTESSCQTENIASVQHAKNTNLQMYVMVQCEECKMWHLVYNKYKLKKPELAELNVAMNDYTYTCGASLSDLCHTG